MLRLFGPILATTLLLGTPLAGCGQPAETPADAPAAAKAALPTKPGETFRECPECSEMVVIPPGKFTMGADGGEPERYEGPVHAVEIKKPFAVGVIPVTNAQFRAFIQDTNYKPAEKCAVRQNGEYVRPEGTSWLNPGLGRTPADNEPVVCINWYDAKAYVDWVAKKTGAPYRLMSEAEWEYVAKAGTTTLYPWGDNPEDACKYGNLLDASANTSSLISGTPTKCSDGYPEQAPTGMFAPNAFGVRDMVGNAWTWTADCYLMPYAANAPTDGSPYLGPEGCDRRSVRGSAWGTTVSRARPTFRGRDPMDRLSQLFGVRIARDLT